MRSRIASLLSFILLTLEASILAVLFLKLYLPLSYYVLTMLLAIILVSLIAYGRPNPCMLAAILVAGLILRMLPMIRTNFSVEPLYDGYKDIVTAELWYRMGRAPILHGNQDLEYTSSFPLLKILTVMYAYIMGPHSPWQLLIVRSALVLTLAYAFVMMLFAHLFGKEVEKRTDLRRLSLVLLLLFAISPDAVYYGMIYYPRYYCAMFIYMLLWMMISGKINSKYFPLASMLMITLPFTYAGYPWILLTFITACYILSSLLKGKGKDYTPSPILLALLMTGIILSWMYYAIPDLLANNLRGAINKLVNWFSIMKHEGLTEREWIETPYYIPPCLRTPFNVLVKVRDIIIYASVLIGIIYMLIKTFRKRGHEVFSILTIHVLTLSILYVVFVEIQRFSFQVVLTPFMYIVLLFAATCYVVAIKAISRVARSKPWKRILLLVLLPIIPLSIAASTAFLSPWSHRILLKWYYDQSIGVIEVGEHNPQYIAIAKFVPTSHVRSYAYLLTDDVHLAMTLYPYEYNKIKHFTYILQLPNKRSVNQRILVISFREFLPDLGFRRLTLLNRAKAELTTYCLTKVLDLYTIQIFVLS